ncbi:DNA helicase RecG [Candidatus Marinamargulisbacteria bacterium SCGC AG-410-N11]|nr:DNA helicase RecG [Candidatus Marinamargulisbacteria bacterium SCGC AG-410-N11]
MTSSLDSSIQYVKGIGPKLVNQFNKLGIQKINDFFYFFPREYEDRRFFSFLSQLKVNKQSFVYVRINSVKEQKNNNSKRSIIKCQVSDRSGSISAIWFNQSYLKKVLKVGNQIIIKGKLERNFLDYSTQIHVQEFDIVREPNDLLYLKDRILSVYSLTAGVYQSQVRKIMINVFKDYFSNIVDKLPEVILKKFNLISLQESIKQLHFPTDKSLFLKARSRVVFDEFFYYQLKLEIKRRYNANSLKGTSLTVNGVIIDQYYKELPYELTRAQYSVIKDISKDLSSNQAMNRLIQGDVGSGKTDVAVFTLLCAVESKKVGALMVPTEVLAEQHYLKLSERLKTLGITVVLLKSKMKASVKRRVLDLLSFPESTCIVVGTHALFQQAVEIPNLAVVVIDEQHRFGVEQRMLIRQKGKNPHCLFMTATPIPRSFMLTLYGDLEKSVIDEMPIGRKAPQNFFVRSGKLDLVLNKCRNRIKGGEQLYIIYPLIEESEKLDLKSAIEGWERVRQIYSEFNVGLIHGRLSSDEKKEVMKLFKDNVYQVLVATTVIEVGVDVPNASMMIINDAERFGLFQLHQLRGRIGRGGNDSYCFFIGNPRSETSRTRINVILSTSDGFKLAEYDLKMRGPGDMLGTRQSGVPNFNLADLVKDESTLLLARRAAKYLLDQDSFLKTDEYKELKEFVFSDDFISHLKRLN